MSVDGKDVETTPQKIAENISDSEQYDGDLVINYWIENCKDQTEITPQKVRMILQIAGYNFVPRKKFCLAKITAFAKPKYTIIKNSLIGS